MLNDTLYHWKVTKDHEHYVPFSPLAFTVPTIGLLTDISLREMAKCASELASWIDYILITCLMHWLLFIHKILFSCTCFAPQVLIFRRIQSYTCSIWQCHSLREFVVACWYTPRTPVESDVAICCIYTTVSSWRWALEFRNMYRKIIFYE